VILRELDMWDVGLTRLDYLIGEETHLDGADLKQLVHLASLDAMRRAVADGLGAEGALVLQILLLLWKNRIQKRSETPYIIAIRDIDLETFLDLDEDRVREGLRQLLPFVRVDDLDLYLCGDIELSLEPLLKKDGRLADRLDLVWRTTHARALIEAAMEAEEAIHCYLGQLQERVDPQAGDRLAVLQTWWRRYLSKERFARPYDVLEVRSDLCAFEDQTAELALVHDGFVGLLARADEYGALFSERLQLAPGARLQALRGPCRVRPDRLDRPGRRLEIVR